MAARFIADPEQFLVAARFIADRERFLVAARFFEDPERFSGGTEGHQEGQKAIRRGRRDSRDHGYRMARSWLQLISTVVFSVLFIPTAIRRFNRQEF
jgi:hypothetical protein